MDSGLQHHMHAGLSGIIASILYLYGTRTDTCQRWTGIPGLSIPNSGRVVFYSSFCTVLQEWCPISDWRSSGYPQLYVYTGTNGRSVPSSQDPPLPISIYVCVEDKLNPNPNRHPWSVLSTRTQKARRKWRCGKDG